MSRYLPPLITPFYMPPLVTSGCCAVALPRSKVKRGAKGAKGAWIHERKIPRRLECSLCLQGKCEDSSPCDKSRIGHTPARSPVDTPHARYIKAGVCACHYWAHAETFTKRPRSGPRASYDSSVRQSSAYE